MTKVTDANNGVWQYGYDAEQKLTSITDAEGRTPTSFEYDSLHRMTKTTRPLSMVTSFAYDANSNRKLMTDPLGRKTATTYDALDRARTVAITNSDATIPQGRSGYTLDYDPEGNLLSIVEQIRTGATTNPRSYSRTYDARNRLATSTDAFSRTVRYGYDATNNVTSFTDAANRQTGYSYDAMNRLDVATLAGGRQVNHDWTADGLLSRVEYGNGMTRAYSYDNADRVTGIVNTHSTTENEEFAYSYDANSNRESETRKRNGATTRSIAYQFDSLNRLTQANYGGGASVSYGYDKVGNRVSELGTEVGGALVNRTFAYDDLNRMSSMTDALDATKSLTASFDLNGNLLKEVQANGQERRYEYDAMNQMTRAASFGAGTETTLGSYDYDFQGRRISKTVGSSTTQYAYWGINVVNEFDGAGQLTASYDFGADLLRSDFAGEGERLYFHDALGSTTSLATNTGATVARYEYDAWGKLISAVQPSANKVNYTGYRKDDETGLDYAQARYYDSSKGRFTSFDPVTENAERMNQPQGMNFYGYVMGNPLRYTDPQGTDWLYKGDPHGPYVIQWFNNVKGAKNDGWQDIETGLPFATVSRESGDVSGYVGYSLLAINSKKRKFSEAFQKHQEVVLPNPHPDHVGDAAVQVYAEGELGRSLNTSARSIAIGMINFFKHLPSGIVKSITPIGMVESIVDQANRGWVMLQVVLHPMQAWEALADALRTLGPEGFYPNIFEPVGEMLPGVVIGKPFIPPAKMPSIKPPQESLIPPTTKPNASTANSKTPLESEIPKTTESVRPTEPPLLAETGSTSVPDIQQFSQGNKVDLTGKSVGFTKSVYPKQKGYVYVLRDKISGVFLKVGKTSGGVNIYERLNMYRRKSQQWGYKIEAEFWEVTDSRSALNLETEIRGNLESQGFRLPWDKVTKENKGVPSRGLPWERSADTPFKIK